MMKVAAVCSWVVGSATYMIALLALLLAGSQASLPITISGGPSPAQRAASTASGETATVIALTVSQLSMGFAIYQ